VNEIMTVLLKYLYFHVGDFNAIPDFCEYGEPLTYQSVKSHRLNMRSVYNDDIPTDILPLMCRELYTTWKAKRTLGSDDPSDETIVKRCIDYIFYCPFQPRKENKNNDKSSLELQTNNNNDWVNYNEDDISNDIVVTSSDQVAISILLRLSVTSIVLLLFLLATVDRHLSIDEKFIINSICSIGWAFFEIVSEGTIFRPKISLKVSSDIETNGAESVELSGTIASKLSRLGKRVWNEPIDSNGRPGV
jgi:hypothetical protein